MTGVCEYCKYLNFREFEKFAKIKIAKISFYGTSLNGHILVLGNVCESETCGLLAWLPVLPVDLLSCSNGRDLGPTLF